MKTFHPWKIVKKVGLTKRGKTETILDFQGDICHIEVVLNFDLTSESVIFDPKNDIFSPYKAKKGNDQLGLFCKTSSICVDGVVVFV